LRIDRCSFPIDVAVELLGESAEAAARRCSRESRGFQIVLFLGLDFPIERGKVAQIGTKVGVTRIRKYLVEVLFVRTQNRGVVEDKIELAIVDIVVEPHPRRLGKSSGLGRQTAVLGQGSARRIVAIEVAWISDI